MIEEDSPEVIAIGEDAVLHGQEGAAGIHQVDAGQAILERDFLRSKMLLDADGVVGAAFHGRVVGHDHAGLARDLADAGNETRTGNPVVVELVAGELTHFEKRRARIEERVHTVARQQLAAVNVPLAGTLVTAERLLRHQRREIRRQRAMVLGIRDECRVRRAYRRTQNRHNALPPRPRF